MGSNRIRLLLEKYWNCETSVEEENELKMLLSESNENEFEQEKALFSYYSVSKEVVLSDSSTKKMEITATEEKMDSEVEVPVKKLGQPTIRWWQIAAAVSGILVASIIFSQMFFSNNPSNQPSVQTAIFEDTYSDPEEALEETKKALAFIAEKLNSGKKQVEKIKVLHEAEERVKENKNQESK